MYRVVLLLLACGLALSVEFQRPVYRLDHAVYYFNDFVNTYNKQYPTEIERQKRLKIFTENLKRFNQLNAEGHAVYGVDQFSDLSVEEFLNTFTGLASPVGLRSQCTSVTAKDLGTSAAPDAFDWRSRNVVTPIKNQGRCGSCYAFSTVGNIESQYAIKYGGVHLDLSEQQLVDCSTINNRCEGGVMTQCMVEIIDAGGLEAETDYRYIESSGSCRYQRSLAKVQLSGCKNFIIRDENTLKEVLYQNGPIAAAVAANAFLGYQGGILKSCPGDVNHAVLIVGYGSENGEDFWLIKNSWAATWGEQGYIRIARGRNMCSIVNFYLSSAIVV